MERSSVHACPAILKDVCIELVASEMLGVVGPNGAGKSTLLRCIDRILKPQRGSILLDEREIKEMSRMELAKKNGVYPTKYRTGLSCYGL
jgi:iron complex transport system ATP-binding protein